MKKLVSIITPTFNRQHMLLRLMKSVFNSTYFNMEMIIINDASTDNTEKIVQKFAFKKKISYSVLNYRGSFSINSLNNNYSEKISKNSSFSIKLLSNKKNMFPAFCKNMGQKIAKGEYILFIDDDNMLEKNMINILVDALEKNPDIGVVGPVNYRFDNKKKVLLSLSRRNMWTTKTMHTRTLKNLYKKKIWETDDVPNAFMVRSEIVVKHNIAFKSQYGIMYEESDYVYRVKSLGYKACFVKDAKIYHDFNYDYHNDKNYVSHYLQQERRAYLFARNRIIFHNFFSTTTQLILIISFWIWAIGIYYSFTFLTNSQKKYTINDKIKAIKYYWFGNFAGLYVVFTRNKNEIFNN